ncbi:hypothetical protein NEF87_004383 [Candidatus Lokiarchaeum ossiferum]|uniref:LD-carboxypeptidase n=1 Tax=Candidatus Lokiarchaeum ossiferum TaxID=2951803 RepID=A0ABY6HX42_9ARCH|nr:hypothetical protein NEF87_004383 [Candidatus Lokiarchaeum sp. B-35]
MKYIDASYIVIFMKKPKRLKPNDKIAIISPSWGGPSIFPHVYKKGLQNIEKYFKLIPIEYPTACMNADKLYQNPKLRAEDINKAFENSEIKAIFISIGGEDSVRILPYLNKEKIINNPKIIMGYSDSSTFLTLINQWGLVTFNGPSIMAGFSQLESLPKEFINHIKTILFTNPMTYNYLPFSQWCEGYLDWAKEDNVGKTNPLKENVDQWHWVQGKGKFKGNLFGGCIEVLEFLKGTLFWPQNSWSNKILFFETSEDVPTISQIGYIIRNYGMQGIFDHISGILFGRARDYSPEKKVELDKMLKRIIAEEFNHPEIPIITNMDFGHTDPQFILPLGIEAEIDCDLKTFKLLESPTTEE